MKRTRVTTQLSPSEMRLFRKVKRFVRAYCGKVSNAEVLRFLIRNWSDK